VWDWIPNRAVVALVGRDDLLEFGDGVIVLFSIEETRSNFTHGCGPNHGAEIYPQRFPPVLGEAP
jgi:hypothetical protein